MPKNLVVCFDGTNNEFGVENTSVVRLVQSLQRGTAAQRLYYDGGVGTLPEPGTWTRVGKWLSKAFGLAVGAGIFWKAEQAYAYLMDHWDQGDEVYIFGFSRGAYTARLLAGMLHHLGLLPRGNHNLIPYASRLYAALGNSREAADEDGSSEHFRRYQEIGKKFRSTFARPMTPKDERRHFRVRFLGLWDTVSSVGWVWDAPTYPFTTRNPSVESIRHAVSIDERRWFFRQNLMRRAYAEQEIVELWFPGDHSDVGGGHPESEGGLWRAPFRWMVAEARAAGMKIDDQRLEEVLSVSRESKVPAADRQHDLLRGLWWLAEFVPKRQWRGKKTGYRYAIGGGRSRYIHREARIHRSALERIQALPTYAPENLSAEFVKRVRELTPDLPTFLVHDSEAEGRRATLPR